jgi:hypothetical protein
MEALGLQEKVYCKKKRTTNSTVLSTAIPIWYKTWGRYVQTNFGGGHQLHKASLGVCLSSGASGCVHQLHSGVEPGAKPESGADPSNLAEGTGPAYSRDSPLRPESPVCGYCLCSAIGGNWSIKEEEVDLSEYEDYWDAS